MAKVAWAEEGQTRDKIQAKMEQKRAYFHRLQVGDRVEFSVVVGRKGNFKPTRQGEIIATSPRHITLAWTDERGKPRKETIIINDFMTGESELRRIGEPVIPPPPAQVKEVVEVGPRKQRPSKEELERIYAEKGSINRVANKYRVSWHTVLAWLKYYNITTKSRGHNWRKKRQETISVEQPQEDLVIEDAPPPVEQLPPTETAEEFTWFTGGKLNSESISKPYIFIGKRKLHIPESAAKMLDVMPRERVVIGISDKAIALKPAPNGLKLSGDKSRRLTLSSRGLIKRLPGWPIPCRVPVELRDGMLVGRRPFRSEEE